MEYKLLEHDKKFDEVFNQFQLKKTIKQRIFFDGQIYDAYSLILDIIQKANKIFIIIDNYIDDSILKMLTKNKNNVKVVILTSDKNNIENLDIQKFHTYFICLSYILFLRKWKFLLHLEFTFSFGFYLYNSPIYI